MGSTTRFGTQRTVGQLRRLAAWHRRQMVRRAPSARPEVLAILGTTSAAARPR